MDVYSDKTQITRTIEAKAKGTHNDHILKHANWLANQFPTCLQFIQPNEDVRLFVCSKQKISKIRGKPCYRIRESDENFEWQ